MEAVLKLLTPILVACVLWLFPENRSHYLYPTTTALLGLSAWHLLFWMRSKRWEGVLPSLGFWAAPIGIFWFMSERREDRSVANLTMPVLLCLFALGTLWVLRKSVLTKEHWPLIIGILLTWGITFFSGSSGSAEPMRRSFGLFGLSSEVTEALVVIVRKLMHISFYGSMAWFFVTHLRRDWFDKVKEACLASFLICLLFASCDEYRQNMMPNREGSIRDVLLDMFAVTIVLWLTQRRHKNQVA